MTDLSGSNALKQWGEARGIPPWEDIPSERSRHDPLADYDYLGRKVPHRLGLPFWLLFVCRLDPARVRRVPAGAIAQEGLDEGGEPVSFVACPCGRRPVVGTMLSRCQGCERYYAMVGNAVFVTYGAMSPPPLGGRISPSSPTTSPS